MSNIKIWPLPLLIWQSDCSIRGRISLYRFQMGEIRAHPPTLRHPRGYMANPQFVNLKLAAASPSLLSSSIPLSSYSQSARLGSPSAPQAEWAAEAISNLRHVVAGISVALLIEGAAAVAIIATWNLWHIR